MPISKSQWPVQLFSREQNDTVKKMIRKRYLYGTDKITITYNARSGYINSGSFTKLPELGHGQEIGKVT